MNELRATELPAGTTADVEVRADGTWFVRVYYGMAMGESRGRVTLSAGFRNAVEDATKERPEGYTPPGVEVPWGDTPPWEMYSLSDGARTNLSRAARDLGISAAELLERLALRVQVEHAGRLALAGQEENPPEDSILHPGAPGAYAELLADQHRTGDPT